MTQTPPTLLCDFYKVSHREQYPEKTQMIYSTWTPRSNKYHPSVDKVVAFGFSKSAKEKLNKVKIEFKTILEEMFLRERGDSLDILRKHASQKIPSLSGKFCPTQQSPWPDSPTIPGLNNKIPDTATTPNPHET